MTSITERQLEIASNVFDIISSDLFFLRQRLANTQILISSYKYEGSKLADLVLEKSETLRNISSNKEVLSSLSELLNRQSCWLL